MKKITAIGLFLITWIAVLLAWQGAFWAKSLIVVVVFALAAAWMVASLAGRAELRTSFVLFPLAATALWPLVQLIADTTVYRWATSVAALDWAVRIAVVFAGLQIFSDSRIRHKYLRALVAGGLLLAIVAPLQRFTSGNRIFWLIDSRYSSTTMGPFTYGNHYAALIELLLPVALACAFFDRPGLRVFHGLSAAVMYASVFAAVSRTGFALTTLELVLVPLVAARRAEISFRQWLRPGLIFLGVVVVLGVAFGPELLMTKLRNRDPLAGRRENLAAAVQMVRDRPLMGAGLGTWALVYPAYAVSDNGYQSNEAHSDWAQWAVEGGIPFLLATLVFAVWSCRACFRSVWGIGVFFVFLQCLTDFPIKPAGIALVLFTLTSASLSKVAESDIERPDAGW